MPTPIPTIDLATLQTRLASFFQYEFDRSGFIGNMVMPVKEVDLKSDNYGVVKLEELLLSDFALERNPDGSYKTNTMQFDQASYLTIERGYEELVDDNDATSYSAYLDASAVQTQRAINQLMTANEIRIASAVMDTTLFGTATAFGGDVSVAKWDAATGVPVDDVQAAQEAIFANAGVYGNALVINRKVFRKLRRNPQILADITSSGAGDSQMSRRVTTQMLQEVFDIDMVLVAGGARNTSNVNTAAAVSHLWADHAMVCQVAVDNDFAKPCIGRAFHWAADGSQYQGTLETYRDDIHRGNRIRIRHQTAEKILHVQSGYLIHDVLT